jgi:uncharacterized damage-inducible protein DinB
MGDDAVRDDAVEKELLNRYLRKARRELLATLDGLSEEQVRWPMTGTGTNLLGLVKHVASVEIDYFGAVFGRPAPALPWMTDDAPVNADMWATEEESRASILVLQAESVAVAEATIAELGLDAPGRVPWWGERGAVTLRQILVHVGFEVSRHAGHADVVRELIDGRAGSEDGNLPALEREQWAHHRERLEEAATAAAARWADVDGVDS